MLTSRLGRTIAELEKLDAPHPDHQAFLETEIGSPADGVDVVPSDRSPALDKGFQKDTVSSASWVEFPMAQSHSRHEDNSSKISY